MWYIALIILIKVFLNSDSIGIVILLLNTREVFVIVSLSLEKKVCQKKNLDDLPRG